MSNHMQEVSVSDAFDKFKPEHCVFVISIDSNLSPSGMALARCMKCSRNPGYLAISIGQKSYTYELIQKSKEFVVAVPNKELEEDLLFFGSVSGRDINKFEKTNLATISAKKIKTPLIKDATINFECILEQEIQLGDSVLCIGKIVATHMDNDKKILLNMKKVNGKRFFEEF